MISVAHVSSKLSVTSKADSPIILETRSTEEAWTAFLGQVQARAWVVYAKLPWGGPGQVLKYLSRSTHRGAISNARRVFVGDGVVRFHYKDYAAAGATRVMELRATECLRRFLLHVVPPGFGRSRHFGLLANRTRQDKLARCRSLLVVVAAGATSPLPRRPARPQPPGRRPLPRSCVPPAGADHGGLWRSGLPTAASLPDPPAAPRSLCLPSSSPGSTPPEGLPFVCSSSP